MLLREQFGRAKENEGRLYISMEAGSDKTIELILRTVISVNQLRIYGAVADTCGDLAWEVSRSSKSTGKPGAAENLETMLMPSEMSTENQTSQTDARVQGTLLREYD